MTFLWLTLLALVTLTPQIPSSSSLPQVSWCVVCGERGSSDALLNLLLFIPLGLAVGRKSRPVVWAAAFGLVLSTSIEFAQHFIPGRYSNAGDVVWDTVGACAGALIGRSRAAWLPPHHRVTTLQRAVATLVLPIMTFLFGWLMGPSWPTGHYWGQWTPELGSFESYRGRVLEARLDSALIPPGRFPDAVDPSSVLPLDWTIRITLVKGPPPTRLAPVVALADDRQIEALIIGLQEEDLVYWERSRASQLLLDQPALRVPGAMTSADAGDTVRLSLSRRGTRRCFRLDALERCPAFTPGRAWALLSPLESLPRWGRAFLDMVWMFLLMLSVGFLARSRRDLLLAAGATALLLALAVAATRLAWPPYPEVAAAAVGLLVGHLTYHQVLRSKARSPR